MEHFSPSPQTDTRPVWVVFPALFVLLLYSSAMTAFGYGGAVGLHALLNPKPAPAQMDDPIAPAVAAELPPPFYDWPETKPAVALVLTGEMRGYMRPCGCSDGQTGGLPRRAGFLEYLQEKKWPTLALDLGDVVDKSGEMELVRYRYSLQSLSEMEYRAIGVGPGELGLEIIRVIGESLDLQNTKLMLANLKHDQLEEPLAQEGQWFKSVVVEQRGECKIAVSVLLQPGGQMEPGASVTPPDDIVASLQEDMAKQNAELKLLFLHAPFEDALSFAELHPGFDLVLSRSIYEDSRSSEAKMVGDTMVTWVGQKGKAVGVVGYWKDQIPKLRFEMVTIDGRFPAVARQDEIYADYVAAIKSGRFLENTPKYPPSNDEYYVGAEKCGECHVAIHDHWKTTKHAHALETLTKAVPAGQDYNPECVQCHVVGLHEKSGFVSLIDSPKLGGVQCENCHGPGGKHAFDKVGGKNAELYKSLQVSRFTIRETCALKCHNSENSIHFNFETYWPKVAHPVGAK